MSGDALNRRFGADQRRARLALLAGLACLCWISPLAAEACSYAVPQDPGESSAQAYERLRRTEQDNYWAEADTVFVGEVEGLRRTAEGIEVWVTPREAFKGDAGTGTIHYDLDWEAVACDMATFPDFESVGLFYASREDDGFTVHAMLAPHFIRDESLRGRVIAQLEPHETASLSPLSRELRLPLLAGLAVVFSFISGLVLGRVWVKRSR